MDVDDENPVAVTREFEWNIEKLRDYLVSEVFTIYLDSKPTKWQHILHRDGTQVYAQLKRVELFTNDVIVDLRINPQKNKDKVVNRKYDAKYFYETWFHIHTIVSGEVVQGINRVSVPQDSFVMQIKISFIRKSSECSKPDESKCILRNYGKFLNSDKLSDFKFVCSDGVEIPAHRFVLIVNSPAMYKMLSPDDTKYQRIVVDDIDGETMLQVLQFLYTGEIKNVLYLESKLLDCAEKYELDDMKKCVVQAMIKNITVDKVLDYYDIAEDFDEQELLEKCLLFIHNNYFTLEKREKWEDMEFKIRTLLKISCLRDGYENPVYVLKSLMTYEPYKLPAGYTPF
jgi:hypothetical protein